MKQGLHDAASEHDACGIGMVVNIRGDKTHELVDNALTVLVFQSIEGLHTACPNHPGDWYFTGRYPTPGGVRLCNEAFIAYVDRSGILHGATDMP